MPLPRRDRGVEGQAGDQPLHRVSQDHQQARLRGGPREQRGDPRGARVQRRPLADHLALGAREVLVVGGDVVLAEAPGVKAVEEVKLLHRHRASHLRVGGDQVVPARRAASLKAHADEVRRTCPPSGRRLRGWGRQCPRRRRRPRRCERLLRRHGRAAGRRGGLASSASGSLVFWALVLACSVRLGLRVLGILTGVPRRFG